MTELMDGPQGDEICILIRIAESHVKAIEIAMSAICNIDQFTAKHLESAYISSSLSKLNDIAEGMLGDAIGYHDRLQQLSEDPEARYVEVMNLTENRSDEIVYALEDFNLIVKDLIENLTDAHVEEQHSNHTDEELLRSLKISIDSITNMHSDLSNTILHNALYNH